MGQLVHSTESHSSDCQFSFFMFCPETHLSTLQFIIQFLYVLVSVAHSIQILHYSSAWIAWFPVLFYSTLYVGDLYKRSMPPAATDEQQILIDDEATRLGSRALFYSALLSLVVSVVLPYFVAEAAGHPPQNQTSSWWQRVCRVPRRLQVHLVTMWAASHLVFASCMFATLCVTSSLQLFV